MRLEDIGSNLELPHPNVAVGWRRNYFHRVNGDEEPNDKHRQ